MAHPVGLAPVAPQGQSNIISFFSDPRIIRIAAYAFSLLGALGTAYFLVVGSFIPAIAAAVVTAAAVYFGFVREGPTPQIPDLKPVISPVLASRIDGVQETVRVKVVEAVSNEIVKDRIAAATLGQGIGDALGLLTEFTTARSAQLMIGGRDLEYALKDDLAFMHGPYSRFRRKFPVGAFTDDTEQACVLVRAIDQKKKGAQQNLEHLFAEQMIHWSQHGLDSYRGQYRSLENPACNDIGNLTRAVLSHPDFRKAPLRAAEETWSQTRAFQDRMASNGAVMRTSVIGSIYHKDLKEVVAKTILFAKVTHADPRCVAASVAVTTALALMIQGYKDVNEVTALAANIAKQVLSDELDRHAPEHRKEVLERYALELEAHIWGNWDSLKLDEGSIGYAYKCMGAAFCALRRADAYNQQNLPDPTAAFRNAIQEVVAQGGDADTNAAPAGALIGAYLGSARIPNSWKEGLNPAARAVLNQTNEMIQAML